MAGAGALMALPVGADEVASGRDGSGSPKAKGRRSRSFRERAGLWVRWAPRVLRLLRVRAARQTREAYFYCGDGQTQLGPVDMPELRALWARGQMDSNTLVWKEGMPGWQEVAEVAGLARRLGGVGSGAKRREATRQPVGTETKEEGGQSGPNNDHSLIIWLQEELHQRRISGKKLLKAVGTSRCSAGSRRWVLARWAGS